MHACLSSSGRLALAAAVLVFGFAAATAAGPGGQIRGGEWGFAGEAEPNARFIQFSGGGRVFGFGGCNRFSGTFSVSGETLAIGPLVATRRACPGDAMQRETEFFRILESTRSGAASRRELVLRAEDGSTLATLQRRDID